VPILHQRRQEWLQWKSSLEEMLAGSVLMAAAPWEGYPPVLDAKSPCFPDLLEKSNRRTPRPTVGAWRLAFFGILGVATPISVFFRRLTIGSTSVEDASLFFQVYRDKHQVDYVGEE
jgi:hypothetical protein